MQNASYQQRRAEIETYFDRTAADAWSLLTSNAPVGRIRETVRAGRDRMRATLLGWLPPDLSGKRILDAGCGTGALALAAAQRGAEVVAIDLSPTLVTLARERNSGQSGAGTIDFRVGDMSSPDLGEFDYAVAMDSLIHYAAPDALAVIRQLAAMTHGSVLFTFAPSNPLLATMHAVGKLFPRGNRSPSIVPVAEQKLFHLLATDPALSEWRRDRGERISSGFYTSQACEISKL